MTMCRVSLWALVGAILCAPHFVSGDGLTSQESRIGEIIQGVVDQYLGQNRDSSALSLALLGAIKTEGVRTLLTEEDNSDALQDGDTLNNGLDRRQNDHLEVAKREAPLPPPELFRDLMVVNGNNTPGVMFMEAGGQPKNCTKRKRRRKKAKLSSRLGIELRESTPGFLVPGMPRSTQRALTEYSHTGVPPIHVDIPRLTIDEHTYPGDTTTRSSSSRFDSSLFAYSVTQRSPTLSRDDEKAARSRSREPSLKPKSRHSSNSHRTEDLAVPSTIFALAPSTLFPPPSSRANRKNPFERFELSTPLPRLDILPEDEGLLPKRAKSKDSRHPSGTTESPWGTTEKPGSDLNDAAPEISPRTSESTTVQPVTQTGPVRRSTEAVQSTTAARQQTTTMAPEVPTTSSPTTTASPALRTAEPTQSRTLVPSSLNKGTLQHFSLYPKYPQMGSQSKIILAVGGARYAPLPPGVFAGLGDSPIEAGDLSPPKYDFNGAQAREQVAVLSETGRADSRDVESPQVELETKNGKVKMDPSVESGKVREDQEDPRRMRPRVLSLPPKVVSGQVFVFSSANREAAGSETSEDAREVTPNVTESSVVETTSGHVHDALCEHTRKPEDCDPTLPSVSHVESTTESSEDSTTTSSQTESPTEASMSHEVPEVNDTLTPEVKATDREAGVGTMPRAPTIIMQVGF